MLTPRLKSTPKVTAETPKDSPFHEGMTPSEIAEIISDRVIEVIRRQFEEMKYVNVLPEIFTDRRNV